MTRCFYAESSSKAEGRADGERIWSDDGVEGEGFLAVDVQYL